MAEPNYFHLIAVVLFSTLMLVAGLYLLTKFNQLFRYWIRNEWVRRNLAVWLIAVCLYLALTPTTGTVYEAKTAHSMFRYFLKQILFVTIEALFVFNITWAIIKWVRPRIISFRKRMGIVLATIILCCILHVVTCRVSPYYNYLYIDLYTISLVDDMSKGAKFLRKETRRKDCGSKVVRHRKCNRP